MKPTDNIIHGFSGWAQPYRFVVVRHTKWDKSQVDMNSMYIVDDPVTAYSIFTQVKEADKLTPREVLYEWSLMDSFGKDAVSFCKQKAENPSESIIPEEVKP